jgi:hypothetical protein
MLYVSRRYLGVLAYTVMAQMTSKYSMSQLLFYTYDLPPSRFNSAYKMLQLALCFLYDCETLLRLLLYSFTWPPVQFRIQFKLCTIAYRIRTGSYPQYLRDVVHSTATTATRSGLHSGCSSDFCISRLRTKFGERAFSFCGPRAWNSSP